jgi:hypothetical protein
MSLPIALFAAAAGALPATLPLDATSRAALPRSEAVLSAHGHTSQCSGVALAALAARAGLPTGEALRGDALRLLLVVAARDGYRVAFTLGEIDPKLGGKPVLLADSCDGKPLAADNGPLRLVVPGEARAARSVRQVEAISVVALP